MKACLTVLLIVAIVIMAIFLIRAELKCDAFAARELEGSIFDTPAYTMRSHMDFLHSTCMIDHEYVGILR
jgi:hypothetical protein